MLDLRSLACFTAWRTWRTELLLRPIHYLGRHYIIVSLLSGTPSGMRDGRGEGEGVGIGLLLASGDGWGVVSLFSTVSLFSFSLYFLLIVRASVCASGYCCVCSHRERYFRCWGGYDISSDFIQQHSTYCFVREFVTFFSCLLCFCSFLCYKQRRGVVERKRERERMERMWQKKKREKWISVAVFCVHDVSLTEAYIG